MKKIAITAILAMVLLSCSKDDTVTNVTTTHQKSDDPYIELPEVDSEIDVEDEDPKENYRQFRVTVICRQEIEGGWAGVGKDSDGQYWMLTHNNSKGITYARKWDRITPPPCGIE